MTETFSLYARPDERRRTRLGSASVAAKTDAMADLPPKPEFCAELLLCKEGVVLGAGTLIARLERRASGEIGLVLAGQGARIYTLLSAAAGRLVDPRVEERFEAVSRALAKGDRALAAIRLSQTTPRLPEGAAGLVCAKMLDRAARRLDCGGDCVEALKDAGCLEALDLQKFNPYHDAAGLFTTATGAIGSMIDSVGSGIQTLLPHDEAPRQEAAPAHSAPQPSPRKETIQPRQQPHTNGRGSHPPASGFPQGHGRAGMANQVQQELSRFPPEIQAAAARYAGIFGQIYGSGVNEGQCAQLTQAFNPRVGRAKDWRPGMRVEGADIPIGTPIATFNDFTGSGRLQYGPPGAEGGKSGKSHTGLYLGQDKTGIYILNQWHNKKSGASGATVSRIRWDKSGEEGAHNYYTISR